MERQRNKELFETANQVSLTRTATAEVIAVLLRNLFLQWPFSLKVLKVLTETYVTAKTLYNVNEHQETHVEKGCPEQRVLDRFAFTFL